MNTLQHQSQQSKRWAARASMPAHRLLMGARLFSPAPCHEWASTDQDTFRLYSHPGKMIELWKALFRFLGLCERQKCPLTPPNSSLASQGAQTQDAAGQLKGLHCRINSDKLQIKKKPVICVKEAAFAAKWIHLSLLLIAPFPRTVP